MTKLLDLSMLASSEYRRILFRPMDGGFFLVGWFIFGVFDCIVETCLCFTGIVREPEFGLCLGSV